MTIVVEPPHPHQVGGGTQRPVRLQGTTCYQNSLPRTRTEAVSLSAGESLEHEWKDATRCQIGVPTVHVGNYRSNPPNP